MSPLTDLEDEIETTAALLVDLHAENGNLAVIEENGSITVSGPDSRAAAA